MPPINQQRSTTGLIVALVVFVILFVTSAIFAMSYYNQLKLAGNKYDDLKLTYAGIIPEGSINGQTVTDLKAAKAENPPKFGITSNDALIDVVTKQRDALIAVIMGTTGSNTAGSTVDAAMKALTTAQADAKAAGLNVDLAPSSPNLLGVIGSLEVTAATAAEKAKSFQASYAAEQEAHRNDMATISSSAKGYQTAASDMETNQKATDATLNSSVDASKAAAQKVADDEAAQAKQLADLTAKSASDATAFQAQIKKDEALIAVLQAKLGNRRMETSQSIVTQVDGKIIRAAGKDVCYINLGQGQQISPGLTFEVYDRASGVPPIPPNTGGDDHLPVGKASIEVTKVGETSSECRVVHLEPGAVLTEGDVIANLVYDPNVKFKFFVYGDFDMSQSGRPSPADADVIRRLITQWGGELTDKINVDTDFVVLGAEPQLPTFTKDELQDPLNQQKLDKAQAALDDYSNKRQTAIDYHIPIMNQNRFLYYVGFYDQAKR
jgi:hypothetical protein